jgi:acetyltransferase
MSLDMFFKPRSIAIIGASSHPHSIANRIVTNLREYGFKGPIYPIHPHHPSVNDLPAFKSIEEVPGDVDLAHVIVRNTTVPDVVRQCGRKGVKGLIINASGFKETGGDGIALEDEVRRAGREAGVRLWGPNCQGCMCSDPEWPLYANFTFARMRPGHVSICAQGGGVAELINNHLAEIGVGFRMYASNGNACDVSLPEVISYWNEDPGTRCIVLHAESFADPAEMLRVLREVDKPVLALKSGTTSVGARAVASHTGTLMEQDTATDLIFDKAGVMRFRTAQELCEAAVALATCKPPRGKRVAMLTNTGSLAITAADEAIPLGIEMPDPSPATTEKLKGALMGIASLHNPVDMMATAGAREFGAAAAALLDDDAFDALLITMVTPFFVDTEAVAREVVRVASERDKPVVMEVLTNDRWASTLDILRQGGLPTYYFPESAARGVAALCRYADFRARPRVEPTRIEIDAQAAAALLERHDADGWLPPEVASALLRLYQVPMIDERSARDEAAAVAAAAELGYPVVLKAVSPGLVHKSDAGGVELGLTDEAAVLAAAGRMRHRFDDVTFLVQRQAAPGGVEVLVGASRVEGLGTSVAFGLGGVLVEVLRDVRFGLAPLSSAEAERMVRSIRGFAVLAGARGRKPVALAPLVALLERVGQLVHDYPSIRELDLNPVIATEHGAVAVDARVRVLSPPLPPGEGRGEGNRT